MYTTPSPTLLVFYRNLMSFQHLTSHNSSLPFNFLHRIYNIMLLHYPSQKLYTKVPSLLHMLWNSSGDIDLPLLTFKPALLMHLTVLILLVVFLLNSDHPDRGVDGDVWGVSWVSRLGFVLLLNSKSSLQSDALHQHLLN